MTSGNYMEAVPRFEKCVELRLSDSLRYFRLVQALELVGDKSEALINYKGYLFLWCLKILEQGKKLLQE